jgi:hypothetical protein
MGLLMIRFLSPRNMKQNKTEPYPKPGHIFPPASLFVVWWYFVIRLYNTVIVLDIVATN